MKKLYVFDENSNERYIITVSSNTTPTTAHQSISAETGGNCLGPADDCQHELDVLMLRWNELEEMSRAEASERILHLAEEWNLSPDELEYLR